MSLKMYLIESNYGSLNINNIEFTKLLVVAENKEIAIQLAKECQIDWNEEDVIYSQKWTYPLYDYETLYKLFYKHKKDTVHHIQLLKDTEEQVLGKWNTLFDNGFFTVVDKPVIEQTNEGFLLKASVIPVDVFNKLLAISNQPGEKTAMIIQGQTLSKLKIKKLRNEIYPLNLKNANSIIHYGPMPADYYEHEFAQRKEKVGS